MLSKNPCDTHPGATRWRLDTRSISRTVSELQHNSKGLDFNNAKARPSSDEADRTISDIEDLKWVRLQEAVRTYLWMSTS